MMQESLTPLLTILISGLISGTILWIWEIKQPLRKIQYLPTFIQDIRELPILFSIIVVSALIYSYVYNLFVFPTIEALTHSLGWTLVPSIPLWLRIIIAILLKDFFNYCTHWLMHHNLVFWRTHKWHHLQKLMYWLKGYKHSLIYSIIAQWDFLAFSLLAIPLNITLMFGLAYSCIISFSHTNIQWLPWMKTVEWVVISPRYHLVHHFNDIQLQSKNLGDIFTFCDRIFGTYVDPETFDPSHEEFGLDKDESLTLKTIIGI